MISLRGATRKFKLYEGAIRELQFAGRGWKWRIGKCRTRKVRTGKSENVGLERED